MKDGVEYKLNFQLWALPEEGGGGNVVGKSDCNSRLVGLRSLSPSWILLMRR